MRKIRKFVILTLVFSIYVIPSFGQSIEQSVDDVVECWEDLYKVNFNFKDDLNQFEQQLLEKRIIKNKTTSSYRDLFTRMQNNKASIYNWLKVDVDKYLPAGPFKHCMKKYTPPKSNKDIRRWVYLFSIYHILSKDFATINIKAIKGDSIFINGMVANMDTFKQVFKIELDVIVEQEIPKEEICVNIDCKSIKSDSLYIKVLKEKIDDYKLVDINYINQE